MGRLAAKDVYRVQVRVFSLCVHVASILYKFHDSLRNKYYHITPNCEIMFHYELNDHGYDDDDEVGWGDDVNMPD